MRWHIHGGVSRGNDANPNTTRDLRSNLTKVYLFLKLNAVSLDNILGFALRDIPSIDAFQHGLESPYAFGAIDDKTKN
jgi:HrpA-like RNA helicase